MIAKFNDIHSWFSLQGAEEPYSTFVNIKMFDLFSSACHMLSDLFVYATVTPAGILLNPSLNPVALGVVAGSMTVGAFGSAAPCVFMSRHKILKSKFTRPSKVLWWMSIISASLPKAARNLSCLSDNILKIMFEYIRDDAVNTIDEPESKNSLIGTHLIKTRLFWRVLPFADGCLLHFLQMRSCTK